MIKLKKKERLLEKIRTIPLEEGSNLTGMRNITAYRFTTGKIHMPQTDLPYLYIALDGVLRLYTPSGIMDYMAGQYSVSKIDTPMSGTVLSFSEQQDFLALAVSFTPYDVITEVLELDNDLTERIIEGNLSEEEMSASDLEILSSVYRIFSAMDKPLLSEFLRKNMMREVIYYTLCGTCGRQFLQSIANIEKADEIYKANSWIKENFRDSFTVGSLAEADTKTMEDFKMILTDELCDRLCEAAKEKSRELGMDISFAISDENGLPRVYRRYGDALVLSITLVPGKAYTSAVTQCKTKDVAACAAEGASLMAIQANDPKITLVAGGYPLFVNGKIAGGIGVGGGTEEQDCEIAEYVVSVFDKLGCAAPF